jgi:carbonic anhydrase
MDRFPDHLANRFRRLKFRHFAPNQDHYEKLAVENPKPEVMIVSCCDSRVDPETLFSAIPGEKKGYMACRRRWNSRCSICVSSTASCWHTRVVAACVPVSITLRRARPRPSLSAIGYRCSMAHEQRFWLGMRACRSKRCGPLWSVRASRPRWPTRVSFPCIQTLASKGRIALHGAYFDIATGTLSVLDRERKTFGPL